VRRPCWTAASPWRRHASETIRISHCAALFVANRAAVRSPGAGRRAVPAATRTITARGRIDAATYARQRDKLREELTLAKIDHHADAIEELDVEGILAFAERILPRASDQWVQASLDYKQRLQQLFLPDGVAYDGKRFNRTAVTAPLFSCCSAG